MSLLAHSVADLVVEGSDWTSKILLGNRGEYLSLILSWFHISEESLFLIQNIYFAHLLQAKSSSPDFVIGFWLLDFVWLVISYFFPLIDKTVVLPLSHPIVSANAIVACVEVSRRGGV